MQMSSLERKIDTLEKVQPALGVSLKANLPSLRSREGIEQLEKKGYSFSFADTSQSLRSKNEKLQQGVEALLSEVMVIAPELAPRYVEAVAQHTLDVAHIILDLIMMPPEKIEVCGRNPKEEFPQLSTLLLSSKLSGAPLRVCVPTCPDSFQYQLSDGIGEIGEKAIGAVERLDNFFSTRGVLAEYDIQIADVEGLDPEILRTSGETVESHFAKTAETRRKIAAVLEQRGNSAVTVSSMNARFQEKGMDYLALQEVLTAELIQSNRKKVRKTIAQLIDERNRLQNFEGMSHEQQNLMVCRELAGYTVYGHMIGGESIILSPDAMSAVPAYHFGDEVVHRFSPVFYAK